MYRATFAETHLVLGRMHIDIDIRRGNFQKQHKGRMSTMIEHVLIGLANRMGYHFVADATAVDKKVLQICLTT